jgi:glycosyltransferase involved in cell wall biosynthesis
MITAILTIYNRPTTIIKQLECLYAQTVVPTEIWVWKNQSPTNKNQQRCLMEVSTKYPDVKIIDSHHNFKYHGRFAIAQLTQTEYIAIIDDDMFPDRKWFENCLVSMEKKDGIMGGMGVKILGEHYLPHERFGWNDTRSNHIERVDVCCQSWFFRKKWLKYLWFEEPLSWDNGEDIQFSYLAKTYGNINSYIPPHPLWDTGLWASDNTISDEFAADQNSTWRMKNHFDLRNYICNEYIKRGWKLTRNGDK